MDSKQFRCDICKIDTGSLANYNSHITGSKHKKKQNALDKVSNEDLKLKCSIFVTRFPKQKKLEVINKFTGFGKIVEYYFNSKSTFAIFEFENESSAKIALRSRIVIDGQLLVVKPKIENDNADKSVLSRPESKPANTDKVQSIVNSSLPFDEMIDQLMVELQLPIHTMNEKYNRVCRDLEMVLSSRFPCCRAYPFGSTITGLGFKTSDLDVYIDVKKDVMNANCASDFTKISRKLLQKTNLFTKVLAIPNAKTPIVKCVHVPTNISCDFNFKSMLGVCNSRLIKFLLSSHRCLLGAMIIIKYWGKLYEISGTGKFTNYCLSMLFIFYLQQKHYLPSVYSLQLSSEHVFIQEGWNGGFYPDQNLLPKLNTSLDSFIPQLLQDFFNFYSNFDYGLYVISPLTGKPILKSLFLDVRNLPKELYYYKQKIVDSKEKPLKLLSPICVQDPFVLNHNITSYINSKLLQEFQVLCETSWKALSTVKDTPNKVFNQLFFKVPKPTVSPFDVCTANVCTFKIPFSFSALESDASSDCNTLSRVWSDKLQQFLLSVLSKVFLFKITAKKEHSFKKSFKTEGKSDVHDNDIVDTILFHCSGNVITWEGRKTATKVFETANKAEFSTTLDKEIAISDYLANVVYKNQASSSETLVDFDLNFVTKLNPIEAKFTLNDISSQKGSFKIMAHNLALIIPSLFEKHVKECNFPNTKLSNALNVETKTLEHKNTNKSENTSKPVNKFLQSIERVQKQSK